MGILIYIPFSTNIGYAIKSLESAFFYMAKVVFNNENNVHFLYKDLKGGIPGSLPHSFSNILCLDDPSGNNSIAPVCKYITQNSITSLFGLDLPVSHYFYKHFRNSGINKIIAYWGAPMSDICGGLKLKLKQLHVRLNKFKPDHFIFESNNMANSAINGRGISKQNISVVNLGIDTLKFCPNNESTYVNEIFQIPHNRKIIFYSGHMEERKGVHIIVKAAATLVNEMHRDDIHFLFTGNRNGEEYRFYPLYKGTNAQNYITFAGYRNDLPQIIPCCDAGVIASTGWDSFTVSSLEIAACGLPLIVSNLQGLPETIEENVTGLLFKPGDHIDLVKKICVIMDNPNLRNCMSSAARSRIVNSYTMHQQIENLSNVLKKVIYQNR